LRVLKIDRVSGGDTACNALDQRRPWNCCVVTNAEFDFVLWDEPGPWDRARKRTVS